jgi:NTP pyrophosphatase (non-canonical NTP hydrolase)
MELSALIESQISADRRRGFRSEFESDTELIAQLEKDLIGLVGEIGEFANVLKKVGLAAGHPGYQGLSLRDAAPGLREELADALIYLMRLSVVVGGNLESDVVQKMRVNSSRYQQLEKS